MVPIKHLIRHSLCCLILLARCGAPRAQDNPQRAELLRLVQTIALPGVTGRLDHMAVDVKRHRLFVAATGNNTVEILDLAAGKTMRSLTGFQRPQGIAYLPDLNRILVTNGGDGHCQLYECDSFNLVSSFSLTENADNVRCDRLRKRVWVGYGSGGLAELRWSDGELQGIVELPAHPEAFQIEQIRPRAFVNVPDANEIDVINLDSGMVIARWSLGKYHANFPMALDEVAHRLYVGCRTPPELLVHNIETGQVVSRMTIEENVDDIFYDEARHRLYLTYWAGFLQVIQISRGDHLASLAVLPTRQGASSSLFVPELGEIYVALPQRGDRDAEIDVFVIQ